MKPYIREAFRSQGISNPDVIKKEVREAKQDIFSRGQIIALEQSWKKNLIESGQTCKCGRANMLTVDHCIPKMILRDLGVDVEREWIPENLVLMCRPCNSLKSGHLDFSNPKTKEMLTVFIAKL